MTAMGWHLKSFNCFLQLALFLYLSGHCDSIMALPSSLAPHLIWNLHISPRLLCPEDWPWFTFAEVGTGGCLCLLSRWHLPSFHLHLEWEDPFIRQLRRFWTGSDQDLWLSSWDAKTNKNGCRSQGEHSLNQDIHPDDHWKMISSKRDIHTKDYGMREEELVLCRKENQGWGPCVDKLVLSSVGGTPRKVGGSDPAEDPVWAKARLFVQAQWFSKGQSIHTLEHHSKTKKGTHFIHATPWINLKGFMLSERASFKAFYIISFIWHYWTGKTIVMENSSVVARGLDWGEGVSVKQLHEGRYWGYGILLYPDRA